MSRLKRAATGVGRWAKRLGVLALVLAALIGVLYLFVQWVGLLNAILYTILFVGGVAFMPFWIALLGADMPFNGMIGRLHVLMGAIAFNHHYLVDLGDKWEWCPGEEERVHINGQWYDIDDGFENRSVLGWRPFGILRFKDEDTLANVRADTAAERDRNGDEFEFPTRTAADGGAVDVTRGGYDEVSQPGVTGTDGTWLVDLKRLFSRGIRKFGDVELVETAEEVIERAEVTPGVFEGWRPVIGTIIGLVFGVMIGWMLFFA